MVVLAPEGPDRELITRLLGEDGIPLRVTSDMAGLVRAMDEGAGVAVITEDVIRRSDLEPLSAWLASQPSWSDFPVIILTERSGDAERDAAIFARMRALGNVTFLDRSYRPMTFVSLVRTGLGSRRRQYEARDHLERIVAGEERLSFALKAGHLGAWEVALPDWTLNASEICKATFGRGVDEDFAYDDLLASIHPEDRGRMQDVVHRAVESGVDFDIEYRVVTPKGDHRWVEMRGRGRYDEAGRPEGLAGVCLDITGRKQAEERQSLLIRELHHRVKNTLATVQAIVGSTARSAKSIEDFYDAFGARIASLAHTHNLLTEEFWQMASLHELLTKELEHYDDEGASRITLSGPAIQLYSDIAVPIGMAIHELTTNAAKYGSLSVPDGRLDIRWDLENRNGRKVVTFHWTETNGPPVEPPQQRGFGTRLLQRVLTTQVRAEISLDFNPGGLQFRMSFPLLPARAEF